ncbi:MAG TPA: hypothetical protein VIY72_17370 [Acidimicrobiales bacterium]
MLFPARLHDGLRDGSVTLAFRSWKRPTVKEGGTLLTPGGQLAIDRVVEVDPDEITEADAGRAGSTVTDVLAMLDRGEGRRTYRVEFHRLGDDPRIAVRADDAFDDEVIAELDRRLARLDAASRTGPWTNAVLRVIRDRPAVVSTELATQLGAERPAFKLNVRKLKALGLTESLDVGYRLSPRGSRYLELRPVGPLL